VVVRISPLGEKIETKAPARGRWAVDVGS